VKDDFSQACLLAFKQKPTTLRRK